MPMHLISLFWLNAINFIKNYRKILPTVSQNFEVVPRFLENMHNLGLLYNYFYKSPCLQSSWTCTCVFGKFIHDRFLAECKIKVTKLIA